MKLANSKEDESPFFRTGKAHPAKSDPHAAAGLVSENDLIGGQRYSQAAGEDDKSARRSVPNDRQRRHEVPFPIEGGAGSELDEQWDVVHGRVLIRDDDSSKGSKGS
jgi:hypothetical protein